jgi:hypothetical protein
VLSQPLATLASNLIKRLFNMIVILYINIYLIFCSINAIVNEWVQAVLEGYND